MATLTAIAALCTCSAAMVPSAMAGTILSGDSFIAPQAAPFDPALFVGNSTAGSAAVTPPVTGGDTYSAVVVGQGGTGNVTVTGSGAAGSATLTATNIVDVGATTTGSLTISNGGAVVSQGGPSPFCTTGCSDTFIGNGAGANGTVTVTGAKSSFTVNGALLGIAGGGIGSGFGTAGQPTSGTLNVLNGATANTTATFIGANNLITGQSQTTGTVNVSGAGSTWTVNNTSTAQGFVVTGLNGSGAVNITNGGTANAELVEVGRNSGAAGSLTVDGSGSKLNLTGAFGGFAAAMLIGLNDGATGTVTVSNGGQIIDDTRGVASAGAPGMIVGGSGFVPTTTGTGSGTLNITGAGSQVFIAGDQGVIQGAAHSGPGMTIGQAGTGTLNVTQGGNLTIIDASGGLGGFAVGGNSIQGGLGQATGTGTVLVSGAGSKISVTSTLTPFDGVSVGFNGPGAMTIANGGTFDTNVNMGIGTNVGSAGLVSVSGGGSLLNVGGTLGTGTNGGTGQLLIGCGGTVTAGQVTAGLNATIGGCGTINGNVTSAGTLKVGASPDALNINGNLAQTGGTIKFEIDPNGHGGFATSTLVLGAGNILNVNGAKIDFSFLNGANPLAFAASGLFDLDTFFRIADPNAPGGTDPLSSILGNGALLDSLFSDMTYVADATSFDITSFAFNTDTGVSALTANAVPEPATLTIFGVGLAGLALSARRKLAKPGAV